MWLLYRSSYLPGGHSAAREAVKSAPGEAGVKGKQTRVIKIEYTPLGRRQIEFRQKFGLSRSMSADTL